MSSRDSAKELEKGGSEQQLDYVPSLGAKAPLTSWEGVSFTEADGKAARRRVDLILVGTLTLYYFMSYLDRSNLGNAQVAGLLPELHMTGKWDYNAAISLYFVPYILFEYPLAILLKKAGPDRLLPVLVFCWGIVTMGQAWIHSKGALFACRFLIGMFEAGLTPCSVIVLSMYVRRFELQKRIAVFFAMISLAGAFAGLLAYAITHNLTGKHGLSGWRWIFLIEGAATSGVALLTFRNIPRSPATAWWLTAPQRAALLAGLEEDNTKYVEAHEETGLLAGVNIIWTNPMTIPYFLLNSMSGFFTTGLPYFIPPIIKGLGTYSAVKTQLMTVPPYALAFVIALVSSTVGDLTRCRSAMLSAGAFLGIIGYIIHYLPKTATHPHMGYASIFLIVGGSGTLSSSVSAWGVSNHSGHVRRATAVSLAFMMSNCIGLCCVWAFRSTQAPTYKAGTALGMTAAVFITIVPPLNVANLVRVNRQRQRRLENLPSDHAFPGGVIPDTDVRFRFSY